MNLELKGRVALVTGAARGIGRATALALAEEHARVVVGYRADVDAAATVAREVEGYGAEAMTLQLDLADDTSLDAGVEEVLARWGRVDALINNAGPFPTPGPFDGQLDGQLRDALRLNLEGPARLIQRVIPVMREVGYGRIVSVSTIHAQDGAPGVVAHTTAKSALHGLTKSLSRELGQHGILVNLVMPGLTLTERALERFPQDRLDQAAERNPTRRNPTPQELARLITFLCSPANSYVNGEMIRHTGGL